MSEFRKKMADARPAERTVPISLRGDLVAELELAEEEYERARRAPDIGGKEGVHPKLAALERIEQLQAEMQDSITVFRLRKLSPLAYRALRAEHPPRRRDDGEYDQGDLSLGFNRDTLFPVLIVACTTEPDDLSAEDWRELLGDTETEKARLAAEDKPHVEGLLNYAQFNDLANAAYQVNEGDISVPFSRAVLRERSSTDGE